MESKETKERETSFPKKSIRVLLLERISSSAISLFVKEGFQVETADKMSEAELLTRIPQFHALGVRSKTVLNAPILRAASRLLCVGCFCIGTDQTDLDVAARQGVAVFNAPFANTRSVAELVIGEMIALARQITDRSNECHNNKWNKVNHVHTQTHVHRQQRREEVIQGRSGLLMPRPPGVCLSKAAIASSCVARRCASWGMATWAAS
jgi:phosphoglycerate dehydrogenase-like enzyme